MPSEDMLREEPKLLAPFSTPFNQGQASMTDAWGPWSRVGGKKSVRLANSAVHTDWSIRGVGRKGEHCPADPNVASLLGSLILNA